MHPTVCFQVHVIEFWMELIGVSVINKLFYEADTMNLM